MSAAKIIVLGVWVLALASFFVSGDSTAAAIGRAVFWVLLVAHAVECAIFQAVLRKAPGSLAQNFARTLVFGVFHVREVREAQARGSAEA